MPATTTSHCVAAMTAADNGNTAYLQLIGEVDMDARAVLADTIRQVPTGHPPRLVVDLAGVSFAGAALPNFLAQLRHANPDTAIILRRPTTAARLALHAVDLTAIATIEDEPAPPGRSDHSS